MILSDPTVAAAMQAVEADAEQMQKDETGATAAAQAADAAKRIAANSRQHFALDVQALYEAIEAATGIAPKART